MTWIYQITPDMKRAERLCNQAGISMRVVVIHDIYDRVHLIYRDKNGERMSPKPYTSKKEAEMIMYDHYIKICKKLKLDL